MNLTASRGGEWPLGGEGGKWPLGGRGEFDRHQGWKMTTGWGGVNLTARRGGVWPLEWIWPLGGVGAGCERISESKQVLRAKNLWREIFYTLLKKGWHVVRNGDGAGKNVEKIPRWRFKKSMTRRRNASKKIWGVPSSENWPSRIHYPEVSVIDSLIYSAFSE